MKRMRIFIVISVIVMVSLACSLGSSPTSTPAATSAPAATQALAATQEQVTPTTAETGGGVEAVKKATIQIEAQGSFDDPQLGKVYNVAGRGSGFIIDPSGIAVTNNHVVTGAALIKVWVGGDTKPRNARVLGASECWDLAVIKIEGGDFPYLKVHSGDIEPGLEVYAAGFPLGDPEYTLTKGIVSKANTDGNTNWASVEAVLEHDARIRPGNSGGPLVDKDGNVLGVNYAGNDQYDLNYAIRLKDAMPVIDQLKAGKDFESIGINGQAVVSEDQTLSGIWVSSVKSGSPADKSGVKSGDILTQMEGLVLGTDGTMSDYCGILRSRSETDTLSIEVLRFETKEYLTGQLNGKELAVNFSFADQLSSTVQNSGSSGGTYSDFVTVQDNSAAIQVSIPSAWSDVNGDPWVSDGKTIGASISAAANLQNFNDTYSEPGVFFGVSGDVAQLVGYVQLLDAYRGSFSKDCKFAGRSDYKDNAFEGGYDVYTGCSGESNTLVVLAVRPIQYKTSYLVSVFVNMMSDADAAALDEILRTFDVVGTLP